MAKYITDISGFFSGTTVDADLPDSLYMKSDSHVWSLAIDDSGSITTAWVRGLNVPTMLLYETMVLDWAMGYTQFNFTISAPAGYGQNTYLALLQVAELTQSVNPPGTGAFSISSSTLGTDIERAYVSVEINSSATLTGSLSEGATYFYWATAHPKSVSTEFHLVTGTIPGSPYHVQTVVSGSATLMSVGTVVVYNNTGSPQIMTEVPTPPTGTGDNYGVYSVTRTSSSTEASVTIFFSPDDVGADFVIGFEVDITYPD